LKIFFRFTHYNKPKTGNGMDKTLINRSIEGAFIADAYALGAMIAKEYGMNIAIESEQHQGTKICVGWSA
jgi:hypothetical protein